MPISKVTTPSEISFFICASAGLFKSLSDQFNDMEGGACRAFPILPILCLILSGLLILCTIRSGEEYSRKEVKLSEKARAEDRQVSSDGSEDGISQQDCSSCRCYFASICRLCGRCLIVRICRNRKSLRNGMALPSVRPRLVC